jgi:HAD superfamily hydrolase (TIGR01450 family)
MNFRKFDSFLFDLDGCIWIYPKLIEGSKEVTKKLKFLGKQVLIISNFSVLSRKEIIKKLKNLGLEFDDLITSTYVIAQFLKNENCKVMAFGKGVEKELKDNKIKIVKKPPVDYLVVGHDLDFNYKKLTLSYQAIQQGAKLIFPSYGRIWINSRGAFPGTSAIVKPIEFLTGKRGVLFGKPSRFMANFIDMKVCSPRKKVVLFGDELDADISLGKKLGYFTVLVKSGVDKKVKGRIKPDLILNSVADIKL